MLALQYFNFTSKSPIITGLKTFTMEALKKVFDH